VTAFTKIITSEGAMLVLLDQAQEVNGVAFTFRKPHPN